jgi:hypothetical protein
MTLTEHIAQCKECREYNTLPAILKRIQEFIRWKELGAKLVIFTFCIGAFGWIGILIAIVFDYLTLIEGGPMIGYNAPELKIQHTESKECLEGKHTFCKYI